MKSYPLHIDENGEVEFPAELLEAAGITDGDTLELTSDAKGRILVRRLDPAETPRTPSEIAAGITAAQTALDSGPEAVASYLTGDPTPGIEPDSTLDL